MSETIVLLSAGIGAILSGLLVIRSTNPVHSVFSLVMAFAFTCILLIMAGAEFLALIFMIVYVGAIAILFLFVVMMLNIRLVELLDNATRYLPIGFIIGLTLLGELLFVYAPSTPATQGFITPMIVQEISKPTNISGLGNYLYTEGWLYFMLAGGILLIAMIGAIVLTLHHGRDVHRQDLFGQVIARIEEQVRLVK